MLKIITSNNVSLHYQSILTQKSTFSSKITSAQNSTIELIAKLSTLLLENIFNYQKNIKSLPKLSTLKVKVTLSNIWLKIIMKEKYKFNLIAQNQSDILLYQKVVKFNVLWILDRKNLS